MICRRRFTYTNLLTSTTYTPKCGWDRWQVLVSVIEAAHFSPYFVVVEKHARQLGPYETIIRNFFHASSSWPPRFWSWLSFSSYAFSSVDSANTSYRQITPAQSSTAWYNMSREVLHVYCLLLRDKRFEVDCILEWFSQVDRMYKNVRFRVDRVLEYSTA